MEAYWLHLLHLLAATIWVGGMLFLPLVITPVFRHRFSPEQRLEMISAIGNRFRPIGWIALAVLLLTGLRRADLVFGGMPELWIGLHETAYGQLLRAKLLLVSVILVLQAVHDFVLGPRLRRLAAARGPGLARARAATIGLALGSLLLTLVVVGLAASLRFR